MEPNGGPKGAQGLPRDAQNEPKMSLFLGSGRDRKKALKKETLWECVFDSFGKKTSQIHTTVVKHTFQNDFFKKNVMVALSLPKWSKCEETHENNHFLQKVKITGFFNFLETDVSPTRKHRFRNPPACASSG